jgi:hypothetical protein
LWDFIMTDTGAKIINLRDFLKSQDEVSNEILETALSDLRSDVRLLDMAVSELITEPHKLKDTQLLKDKASVVERGLVDVLDYLEDKIAEEKDGTERKAKQDFLKQCEQLISRNERVKKNIADDLTACRYTETREALDPIKVFGALTGAPLAAASITRILTNRTDIILEAASVGAVIGGSISFHRQLRKTWNSTAQAVLSAPDQVHKSFAVYYVKTSARNSIMAMAWAFAVYAKSKNQIGTDHPERRNAPIKPQAIVRGYKM